jgi:hypothetical protein
VDAFDGGFVTCGSIYEGVDLLLAESWSGTDSALHQIAFAALPDNHTVVALQYCRMGNRRGYVAAIKGLHLNVPNDLFNGYRRRLFSEAGELDLVAPAPQDELLKLDSRWANIDNRIGAIGLYGSGTLALQRSHHRRAGAMRSLHVEHLCWPCETGPKKFEAGEVILDAGWVSLASVNAGQTAAFAQKHDATASRLRFDDKEAIIRALRITGLDGRTWLFIANFDTKPVTLTEDRFGVEATFDPGCAKLLPVAG